MTTAVQAKGQLHITDHTGDTTIEWDPSDPIEVNIAKASYDAAKAKGYLAYSEDDQGEREIMREWNPRASRVVMIPQTVGG